VNVPTLNSRQVFDGRDRDGKVYDAAMPNALGPSMRSGRDAALIKVLQAKIEKVQTEIG